MSFIFTTDRMDMTYIAFWFSIYTCMNYISLLLYPCVLVAQLCPTLQPQGLSPARLLCPWDFPGKNTGVGCHSLLQGIFPTQGSNSGLLHCGWILYQLSYQGSPRTLECVAYPFSRGTSWPRNQTGVSCIAGLFFTSRATQKKTYHLSNDPNIMNLNSSSDGQFLTITLGPVPFHSQP